MGTGARRSRRPAWRCMSMIGGGLGALASKGWPASATARVAAARHQRLCLPIFRRLRLALVRQVVVVAEVRPRPGLLPVINQLQPLCEPDEPRVAPDGGHPGPKQDVRVFDEDIESIDA